MNDSINGLFALVAGLLTWWNVWVLYKEKEVKGVSWQVTGFFTAWSLWALYYYPAIGQWVSFVGELALVGGNLAWVILALWYIHKAHQKIKYSDGYPTRQTSPRRDRARGRCTSW